MCNNSKYICLPGLAVYHLGEMKYSLKACALCDRRGICSMPLKRKQPWNNVANSAAVHSKSGKFSTPQGNFVVFQKRLVTNLVTFPCAIGNFSGILETDVNACIVPQQFPFQRALTQVKRRSLWSGTEPR